MGTVVKYGAIGVAGGAAISLTVCLLGIALAVREERALEASTRGDEQ